MFWVSESCRLASPCQAFPHFYLSIISNQKPAQKKSYARSAAFREQSGLVATLRARVVASLNIGDEAKPNGLAHTERAMRGILAVAKSDARGTARADYPRNLDAVALRTAA